MNKKVIYPDDVAYELKRWVSQQSKIRANSKQEPLTKEEIDEKATELYNKSNKTNLTLFLQLFDNIQKQINRTAHEKGWWDKPREDGTCIALMHSELSEALEALRNSNPPDDKIPDYNGCEAELADVIIRILDFAEERNLKVTLALIEKINYNKTRKHKHGGKQF